VPGVAVDGQSNTYVVGSYRFASVVRLGNLAPLPTVNDPKAVGLFVAKLGRQSPFGVADAGCPKIRPALPMRVLKIRPAFSTHSGPCLSPRGGRGSFL